MHAVCVTVLALVPGLPCSNTRKLKSKGKVRKARAETSRDMDVSWYRRRVDVGSMSRDVSAPAFPFNFSCREDLEPRLIV